MSDLRTGYGAGIDHLGDDAKSEGGAPEAHEVVDDRVEFQAGHLGRKGEIGLAEVV
jgi:hypothetical protein